MITALFILNIFILVVLIFGFCKIEATLGRLAHVLEQIRDYETAQEEAYQRRERLSQQYRSRYHEED